jgi:hypothetical protein
MRRSALIAVAVAVMAATACSPDSTEPDDGGTSPSPLEEESPEDSSLRAQLERAELAYEAYFYCMVDRGWELTRLGDRWIDGSESGGIPEEQLDAYHADDEECGQQSGRADLGTPSVSAEEAALLYDLLLEVAVCVRDLGYQVPDPPSKQSFVDDLVAYPIPAWHPHNASTAPEDRQRIMTQCPVPPLP